MFTIKLRIYLYCYYSPVNLQPNQYIIIDGKTFRQIDSVKLFRIHKNLTAPRKIPKSLILTLQSFASLNI